MGENASQPLVQLGSIINESSDVIEELLEIDPVGCGRLAQTAVWESRVLWGLSGASIIVSIFNFMLSLSTQMFAGHLGALELAGASIANVGIQGLAYGIMVGSDPIFFLLLINRSSSSSSSSS